MIVCVCVEGFCDGGEVRLVVRVCGGVLGHVVCAGLAASVTGEFSHPPHFIPSCHM